MLTNSFPDFSAEKLIDGYYYFEKMQCEMAKKINELEEDKLQLERNIAELKNDHHHQLNLLFQENLQKNQKQEVNTFELELKEAEQYKDQYQKIFKKLLQVYCDWTSKSKALLPDKLDNGPRAKLTDPIEMLAHMERMIKFSTNEKLQVHPILHYPFLGLHSQSHRQCKPPPEKVPPRLRQ